VLFAYSDDNPSERFPVVNIALIATNVIITLSLVFSDQYAEALEKYAFYPAAPTLTAMLTSAFLHGGAGHLVGNMWFLWIFGDNVEDRMGHVLYLLFYLACAFAGDGLHAFVVTGQETTRGSIGASGAISGVMAAYLILYPWAKINFFYWFFIFLYGVVQVPALFVIGFWFVGQLTLALVTYGETNVQIGYWAHLGGFALGLLVVGALRVFGVYKAPRDLLLDSSPSFRKALEEKATRRTLPAEPDPLRQRAWESLRVRTTTVAGVRAQKEKTLLLRALERDHPAGIVKYYSLFEQAFPTLALPEPQQWKAAQVLDREGSDVLALEAYRKIVDQYPFGPHGAAACLRAGEIYFLHHNYERARQYLSVLVRRGDSDPETEAARKALDRVEEVLDAVEVEAPEASDEKPAGPFLILRQTFGKIDVARVGDVIAEHTGEYKLDVQARVVRGQGVLAEGMEHGQAKLLAQWLQAIGVPVLVVSREQLLAYPEVAVVRRAQLDASQATFETRGGSITFPWSDVWLVSCVRMKRKSRRVKTTGPIGSVVGPMGATSGVRTTRREVVQTKRVRVLDLFCTDPPAHLRIEEDHFLYDCLPDELKKSSRMQNFPLLVKEIVRLSPNAHVGPGIDRLLSEESLARLTFNSDRDLDRYLFWLVQLCNLTPKAKET